MAKIKWQMVNPNAHTTAGRFWRSTGKNAGELLHYDNCISLRYDYYEGTRTIKLLNSNEIRKVRDICIYQINGMEVFL